MPAPTTEPTIVTRDDLRSLIGEGFHTAFRKALDGPPAHEVWRMIRALPDKEWREVIDFVVSGFPESAFTVPPKRKRRGKQ